MHVAIATQRSYRDRLFVQNSADKHVYNVMVFLNIAKIVKLLFQRTNSFELMLTKKIYQQFHRFY